MLTKQEQYRTAKANRAKMERQNQVEERQLLPASDVHAQHRLAATSLRKGTESLRREVAAVCPDDVRDAVLAVLDTELERLRRRIARSLRVDGTG